MGSLRRVADIVPSTPNEPQEPVREPQPPDSIKQVAFVAPRTPSKTGGGSSRTQCTGGDDTVFPAQNVRFKQGKLKLEAEATPADDRLETQEEEQHLVQTGAIVSPDAPYPLQMGVFCLPLGYM